MAGDVSGSLQGTVLVGLGSRLWIGGAANATSTVEHDGPGGGGSIELGVGYGGLVITLDALEHASGTWSAGLLLGGGNVDASDPLVGTPLGSDNFVVILPTVRLRRTIGGPFQVGVTGGYRFAAGVQDIPSVDNGSLSGFTLGVSLGATRR